MPGVALFGITGRMGQCLVRALASKDAAPFDPALVLSGALASPASARLGSDAGGTAGATGIPIVADVRRALEGAAVAIDFSRPEAAAPHAAACASAGIPLLIGTTGLDPETLAALAAAAERIALILAPNTSLGVAVLERLTGMAAAALGCAADVEIAEAHHRAKRDAPSGTALALGEAVAAARGARLDEVAVIDRSAGSGVRRPGSIGFASVRGGDIVGEHTVTLALDGERLELTHRATDRMIFARGALAAAAWLIGRPPGRYTMADVLGMDRGHGHR